MAVFKPDNVEDLYEMGEVLGSGHFGQVRKVRERSTGTLWAGKFLKIRKSQCSLLGLERSNVEREVMILEAVQHPNIVTLKDVFESRAEVVLILELVCGGELFDFIAEKENLLESEAIEFLKQILEALRFMHGKNVVHFDLKPENIMLSDKSSPQPIIKLIDFGLARRICQGEEFRSTSGTPQYIAPEVINCEPLNASADMCTMCTTINLTSVQSGLDDLNHNQSYNRSIGVITYILLSGLSPFQDETDEETLANILAMKFEFNDRYFSTTSSMAKDFIQKLLVKDPSERMTAEDSLHHPWIKPLTRSQKVKRNRSSINMKSFKKFNARRKWKMSYNMVRMCNRLVRLRLLCKSSDHDPVQRDCESDIEDTESKPASLLRRRLSSSS
ncbi:death-associated protein kinase 2 [Xyrichtys novacula]|uniref:non-specific serine/threonine protein kinase n=1 Tax=Xyrichtys novacula TaxID=13765 RepID=A0AAV1HE98_XYRNO|nr:death-associated protein kinase 2 [Xyrichtys novacula]